MKHRDADGIVHDIGGMDQPIGSAVCGWPPIRQRTGLQWDMNDQAGSPVDDYRETTCIYCKETARVRAANPSRAIDPARVVAVLRIARAFNVPPDLIFTHRDWIARSSNNEENTMTEIYDSTEEIAEDVFNERERAHEKHKVAGNSMEDRDWDSHRWMPVLTEEVGEVARAINDMGLGGVTSDSLRAELVQVAAMAFAWIAAIDRYQPLVVEQSHEPKVEWDDIDETKPKCGICGQRLTWANPEAVGSWQHPRGPQAEELGEEELDGDESFPEEADHPFWHRPGQTMVTPSFTIPINRTLQAGETLTLTFGPVTISE